MDSCRTMTRRYHSIRDSCSWGEQFPEHGADLPALAWKRSGVKLACVAGMVRPTVTKKTVAELTRWSKQLEPNPNAPLLSIAPGQPVTVLGRRPTPYDRAPEGPAHVR